MAPRAVTGTGPGGTPDPTPDTVEGWRGLAGGLLSDPCCAFHRNVEISAKYAWLYGLQPGCFKWAAMAAIASHHVRIALFPLRIDADGTGYVPRRRDPMRRRLLVDDVHVIRETINAIYDDIFWVHLAYATGGDPSDGIGNLELLRHDDRYRPVLTAFEAIDRGRRLLEQGGTDLDARAEAEDLIWKGNVALLEHEQTAMVQPHFDRLSCAFARLISIGSATSFEVRGLGHEVGYFTSFYGYSLTRGLPTVWRARTWPRITHYDERWSWLVGSVVPRFRKLDGQAQLVRTTLDRISDEASALAAMPCLPPLDPEGPHDRST